MVNKNETTNREKKPIIDNDEALRLIDLSQPPRTWCKGKKALPLHPVLFT